MSNVWSRTANELGPLSRTRVKGEPVATELLLGPPIAVPQPPVVITDKLLNLREVIIPQIMLMECSWIFSEPDPDVVPLVNYPMDLGSIMARLDNKYYLSAAQCQNDIKLMLANCCITYPEGHLYFDAAMNMGSMFRELTDRFPMSEIKLDSANESWYTEFFQLCARDEAPLDQLKALLDRFPIGGRLPNEWCSAAEIPMEIMQQDLNTQQFHWLSYFKIEI